MYMNVIGRVSVFALNKIEEQRVQLTSKTLLGSCDDYFRATMGLPCIHELEKLGDKPLAIDHIHRHWHLEDVLKPAERTGETHGQLAVFQQHLRIIEEKFTCWTPAQQAAVGAQVADIAAGKISSLLDPLLTKSKGRPPGACNKAKKTTARNLSAFEYTTKQQRHCSICGAVNHDRRNCSSKTRRDDILSNLSAAEHTKIPYLGFCLQKVMDVHGDGNYGFHTVAVALKDDEEE